MLQLSQLLQHRLLHNPRVLQRDHLSPRVQMNVRAHYLARLSARCTCTPRRSLHNARLQQHAPAACAEPVTDVWTSDRSDCAADTWPAQPNDPAGVRHTEPVNATPSPHAATEGEAGTVSAAHNDTQADCIATDARIAPHLAQADSLSQSDARSYGADTEWIVGLMAIDAAADYLAATSGARMTAAAASSATATAADASSPWWAPAAGVQNAPGAAFGSCNNAAQDRAPAAAAPATLIRKHVDFTGVFEMGESDEVLDDIDGGQTQQAEKTAAALKWEQQGPERVASAYSGAAPSGVGSANGVAAHVRSHPRRSASERLEGADGSSRRSLSPEQHQGAGRQAGAGARTWPEFAGDVPEPAAAATVRTTLPTARAPSYSTPAATRPGVSSSTQLAVPDHTPAAPQPATPAPPAGAHTLTAPVSAARLPRSSGNSTAQRPTHAACAQAPVPPVQTPKALRRQAPVTTAPIVEQAASAEASSGNNGATATVGEAATRAVSNSSGAAVASTASERTARRKQLRVRARRAEKVSREVARESAAGPETPAPLRRQRASIAARTYAAPVTSASKAAPAPQRHGGAAGPASARSAGGPPAPQAATARVGSHTSAPTAPQRAAESESERASPSNVANAALTQAGSTALAAASTTIKRESVAAASSAPSPLRRQVAVLTPAPPAVPDTSPASQVVGSGAAPRALQASATHHEVPTLPSVLASAPTPASVPAPTPMATPAPPEPPSAAPAPAPAAASTALTASSNSAHAALPAPATSRAPTAAATPRSAAQE